MAKKQLSKAEADPLVYVYNLKSISLYDGMSYGEFRTAMQEFLDAKIPDGTVRMTVGYREGYDNEFTGFYVHGFRPETEAEKTERLDRLKQAEDAKKKTIEKNKDREYKVFLRLKKKFEGG